MSAKNEQSAVIEDGRVAITPRRFQDPAFERAPSSLVLDTSRLRPDFLPKHAEGLFAAKTNDELVVELAKLLEEVEFNSFIIAVYCRRSVEEDGVPSASVIGRVSRTWLRRYEEEGYVDVDPRLSHCIQNVSPYTWDYDTHTTIAAPMFEEAAAHGLRAGISCPLLTHDGFVGMFSASTSYRSSCADLMAPAVRSRFLILRDFLSQLVSTGGAEAVAHRNNLLFDPDARLSKREAQVLLGAAMGFTIPEIADRIHLAESTTRMYLATAKARIGARNLNQAIALAVKHNLIPFPA